MVNLHHRIGWVLTRTAWYGKKRKKAYCDYHDRYWDCDVPHDKWEWSFVASQFLFSFKKYKNHDDICWGLYHTNMFSSIWGTNCILYYNDFLSHIFPFNKITAFVFFINCAAIIVMETKTPKSSWYGSPVTL